MPRSIEDIIASADQLAERFERYAPKESDRLDIAAFVALRAAAERRAGSEQAVADAVVQCRVTGYSWNMVGALLGTSGEAARQRYGALAAQSVIASADASPTAAGPRTRRRDGLTKRRPLE